MFCIAATLLPLHELRKAVRNSKEKITAQKIDEQDMKRRAQILKDFLSDCASREGVELKLRRKKTRRLSSVED